MQPSTGSSSHREEARYIVRRWSEPALIDISPFGMALCTECLRFMTGRALRLASFCIDPMGKPVVQIVDILKHELIGRILDDPPVCRLADEAVGAELLEPRTNVAILAKGFRVTGLTAYL